MGLINPSFGYVTLGGLSSPASCAGQPGRPAATWTRLATLVWPAARLAGHWLDVPAAPANIELGQTWALVTHTHVDSTIAHATPGYATKGGTRNPQQKMASIAAPAQMGVFGFCVVQLCQQVPTMSSHRPSRGPRGRQVGACPSGNEGCNI